MRDAHNKFMIGSARDGFTIMNVSAIRKMDKEDCKNLIAWIAVLANITLADIDESMRIVES